MWKQIEFGLKPRPNGFHLITGEIMKHLPELPRVGMLNLFIKHTSAALTINENADSDVRVDMKSIFDRLVKEGEPYYEHTMEGLDDMPAHAKASISFRQAIVALQQPKIFSLVALLHTEIFPLVALQCVEIFPLVALFQKNSLSLQSNSA